MVKTHKCLKITNQHGYFEWLNGIAEASNQPASPLCCPPVHVLEWPPCDRMTKKVSRYIHNNGDVVGTFGICIGMDICI